MEQKDDVAQKACRIEGSQCCMLPLLFMTFVFELCDFSVNLRSSGQPLTYFQVFSALGVVLLPDDRGPPLPSRVPRDLSAIEQLVWTERTVWISEKGKKTFELHFTETLMCD